jgi:hypothetical protein
LELLEKLEKRHTAALKRRLPPAAAILKTNVQTTASRPLPLGEFASASSLYLAITDHPHRLQIDSADFRTQYPKRAGADFDRMLLRSSQ